MALDPFRALAPLIALAACGSPPPPPTPTPPPTPVVASPANVRLLDAPQLRAEIRASGDKPRMYNFWATWCGPCVKELPTIRAYAEAHPQLEVVLVNLDDGDMRESHVLPFVAKHQLLGLDLVQLQAKDPAGAMYGVVDGWPDGIPVTLFVRPDGTAVRQFNGMVHEPQLDAGLALAAEKPPG